MFACIKINSVQSLSCVLLSDPMDCSTPSFPILDDLSGLAQTHVHWVGDIIQPSHPLSSPSPPASGSFPMSHLFASGGQSIGASASASVHLRNIQYLFPLGLTGLICLQSKGHSRVFFNYTAPIHQLFGIQPSLWSNFHIHFTIGKTIALTIQTFVGKVMSLLLNMLSKLVITFLTRIKSSIYAKNLML